MEQDTSRLEPAILVRGITKQYGKDPAVLDNLDVTVVKGTIYALLGASGCGKTTLLSSILGSRKIQSGSISILGQPPGVIPIKSIGYMPQDIALVGEMTIKNVLQQQGWIFGMTDQEIDERHKFCEQLLDLPPGNKLVKNLSGGQQRRVSLAVVLIQDPELLILDEPTVGLDPILRQNLWDYLIKITKDENKTVMITTHYIEEAKQADMLGMLRNGKMLIEGEPQTLMNQFNYNSLEDLFISLSAKQEASDPLINDLRKNNQLISKTDENNILNQIPPKKTLLKKMQFTNKGHAKALLSKNFFRYVRNPGTLAITLILPLIQISAVFIAIRVPDDLVIGIVNQELGEYRNCEDYVNDNRTMGGFVLDDEYKSCGYEGLACKYLEKIHRFFSNQIYFETVEDALKEFKGGKMHYVLFFPQNYSEAFTMVHNYNDIHPEDVDASQIIFYKEEGGNPFTPYLEKDLYDSYRKFAEELAVDCQLAKGSGKVPIVFNKPIYGNPDFTYSEFVAPGMMNIIVLGLASALAVFTIVGEKNGGVWERTIVSGVKPSEILIFHLVTLSFTSAIQSAECFFLPYFVFGFDCEGNLLQAFLLLYSQALVGATIGISISVISKNEIEAIFGALGISLPFFMLSGFFWPLEGMHEYLRYFSYAMPPTVPTQSLNSIVFRGWGITNIHVLKGYLTSIAYIFFLTVVSIFGLKFEKK